MIETLNTLKQMDVDAARGVRNQTDLDRRRFKTTHEQNPDYIDVLLAGDGIIVITDRYEKEDFAWSGRLDDQELLDNLVEDGVLTEEKQ